MIISSPCKGVIKKLEDVNDVAFAQKMMGDGVAVLPTEGVLHSPVDGIIKMIFPTMHAIGIESDEGIEILLHIGIDTVELTKGFTSLVEINSRVQKQQALIRFDLDYIKESGYETDVMVIVTNTKQYKQVTINHEGDILVGEKLLKVI